MGGAIYKDKGATEYTERNIFLNSQETYGRFVESYSLSILIYILRVVYIRCNCIHYYFRLKPVRPITIHQKALFCLWVIIICLCTVVKVVQFWKWILSKRKRKDTISKEQDIVESQKHTGDAAKQDASGCTNGGN